MQERRNSSALAMELRLSCTNPSTGLMQEWCNSSALAMELRLSSPSTNPSTWPSYLNDTIPYTWINGPYMKVGQGPDPIGVSQGWRLQMTGHQVPGQKITNILLHHLCLTHWPLGEDAGDIICLLTLATLNSFGEMKKKNNIFFMISQHRLSWWLKFFQA